MPSLFLGAVNKGQLQDQQQAQQWLRQTSNSLNLQKHGVTSA